MQMIPIDQSSSQLIIRQAIRGVPKKRSHSRRCTLRRSLRTSQEPVRLNHPQALHVPTQIFWTGVIGSLYVPKPYQEFKDIFTKESFDELPYRKKWDHAIELVPDAQKFSTKVYPLELVKQKQ